MIAPPGSKLIDYVLIGFDDDALASDLTALFESSALSLVVNGQECARCPLAHLPVADGLSRYWPSTWRWGLDYRIRGGDEISVRLETGGAVVTKGGLTFHSGISILGEAEVDVATLAARALNN